MATITLTLDQETLERLKNGEPLTLTATLRERKPKTSTQPLPEHLREAFEAVTALYAQHQPDVSPALAWKTLKPLIEANETSEAIDAIAIALEWNDGRKYPPHWLAKDFGYWMDTEYVTDPFTFEEKRTAYRKRLGLS